MNSQFLPKYCWLKLIWQVSSFPSAASRSSCGRTFEAMSLERHAFWHCWMCSAPETTCMYLWQDSIVWLNNAMKGCQYSERNINTCVFSAAFSSAVLEFVPFESDSMRYACASDTLSLAISVCKFSSIFSAWSAHPCKLKSVFCHAS